MDKIKQKQINQIYYQANHKYLPKLRQKRQKQLYSKVLDTDIDPSHFMLKLFRSNKHNKKIKSVVKLNRIKPLVNLELVSLSKQSSYTEAYLTKLGLLLDKHLYKMPNSTNKIESQKLSVSIVEDFYMFIFSISLLITIGIFISGYPVISFIMLILTILSGVKGHHLDNQYAKYNKKLRDYHSQMTIRKCLPFLKKHVSNHDYIKDRKVFINEVTK